MTGPWLDPLPPKIAAKLFDKDPDLIAVNLSDLLDGLGLTFAELLPDLRSGALVATTSSPTPKQGLKDGDIWFTGSSLVAWLATRPDLTRDDQ